MIDLLTDLIEASDAMGEEVEFDLSNPPNVCIVNGLKLDMHDCKFTFGDIYIDARSNTNIQTTQPIELPTSHYDDELKRLEIEEARDRKMERRRQREREEAIEKTYESFYKANTFNS